MNDKQRIAELERQLAEISPPPHVLLRIEGKDQKIIGSSKIRRISKNGYIYSEARIVPIIEVISHE